MRKCPACERPLAWSDRVLEPATTSAPGKVERTFACAPCRHSVVELVELPRIGASSSSDAPSSFDRGMGDHHASPPSGGTGGGSGF